MNLPLYLRKTINHFPLLPTIILLSTDVFFIAFSVWLSFFLRFEGIIPAQYFSMMGQIIIFTLFFCIPIFYFVGLYSFSWSYAGINELLSLAKAVTISFLFLAVTLYFSRMFPTFSGYPRSTLITSFILVIIFCGFSRLSKRIYIQSFKNYSGREKTLIVGAGDAGEQILRSIISSKNSPYAPAGFVDDSPAKKGVLIHGFKVFGKISDIPNIVKVRQIKQLIIALPTAGSKTIKDAIELARKAGLEKIKIAPHINEIISGEVSLKNLKDVGAEDLLNRDRILLNTEQIKNFIKDKAVLITGASGSIGSELSRQTAGLKPSLLLLIDQDETGIFNISNELSQKFPNLKIQSLVADVADKVKINEIFKKFQPEIIFHAAAYKHVPLMEQDPAEAVKNNIFGTKIVAEAALESGAEKFVFISTDKAVNPTSVMGATKRVGEMICQVLWQKNKTKFISVRFGNVLDSRGSVIPTFRDQIKKGGPVTVTDPKMERYFMLIPEACLLVMQASAMGQGGEVFVLDMGKPIKILDLAKTMIEASGLVPDKDIAIVFSGKRPGEKLFEEILTAEEGVISTPNQRIFIAKLFSVDDKEFHDDISVLSDSFELEKEEIVKILRKILPNYL
jgi:FlaA1/EpsC-like NDP-sugar epimerase